ncbi:transcriptional regulator [Niallia circulans]|nr:transcriptional regulator [Niallia circulans]
MYEFLTPKDIQDILKVGETKAYEIIRQLNKEMKRDGYMIVSGKVNKAKFEERYIYKNKNKAEVG